ncbi:ABC transporter ATP-binding protein [Marispirochaeta aestuarii]|uniref:ABC transporter ATP-binding protein n=1 Tax=Marispirochaeta aestuarii TaxID=1963862 RepID=UPI0029C77865|nr:ABC transporter ATP-binding protein [Marispirochaeta aestuarii]
MQTTEKQKTDKQNSADTMIDVKGLSVNFYTQRGVVKAVRNLSFSIPNGKTLALVGESGCGKSVTAHSINQLLPVPPGKIVSGEIWFKGEDLLKKSEKEMQKIRGEKISMIFQEPMTSLNPVFSVGKQIADVFLTHHALSKAEAWERAVELLNLVKIPSPAKRAESYPHQLSGGMRQRAMIAMALASPDPGLMIADEPTTALDVTIQAQILDLMVSLQQRIGMSLLLITHDMGVVAETADHVVVMYAGRKVEEGDVFSLFREPSHPYTLGLMNSLPSNEKYRGAVRLEAIPGTVPDLLSIGEGCPFMNRCRYATEICGKEFPDETRLSEDHSAWCHNLSAVKESTE